MMRQEFNVGPKCGRCGIVRRPARAGWNSPAGGGARVGLILLVVMAVGGCGRYLMPTPNLYANGCEDPFDEVPVALRNNCLEVLYVTDRQIAGNTAEERSVTLAGEDATPARTCGSICEHPRYGFGRSRSMAFGVVPVCLGRNVSWPELVEASLSRVRLMDLPVEMGCPVELGRFPPTPPRWVRQPDGEVMEPPGRAAEQARAEAAFRELLERRLAVGEGRDVYLYIHGVNNDFDDSVMVIGQIWHFLGRRGVPIAYSWPAGSGGLRGYAYDRESGEFTVFHLKHLLRLLGDCRDVERVHIIAHSRGTAVLLSALRELHLQFRCEDRPTREVLKLGTVVLAAPDIDLDVALQRLAAEQLFRVPETTVVYVSEGDWALRLANWLFFGTARFGRLRPSDLPREELEVLRETQNIQLIDAYDASTEWIGHSYFYRSPAVSSDLILVLRDGRQPGAEHGRPLRMEADGFWRIDLEYPRVCPPDEHPATMPACGPCRRCYTPLYSHNSED